MSLENGDSFPKLIGNSSQQFEGNSGIPHLGYKESKATEDQWAQTMAETHRFNPGLVPLKPSGIIYPAQTQET